MAEVSVETTPSVRKNKRKEATHTQDSAVQQGIIFFLFYFQLCRVLISFALNSDFFPLYSRKLLPPSKAKKLRKKAVNKPEEREEPVAAPTETIKTDEELQDAFEAVEQEKGQQEGEEDVLKKKDKELDEEVRPHYLLVWTLCWFLFLII